MPFGLRLSVRTKILSGFVLVFILFLSVLTYCVLQMRQIQWQLGIVQKGYMPLTKVVARIDNNQQGMERYLDPDRLLSRERVPTNLYQSLALFHLGRVEESLRAGNRQVEAAGSMPGAEGEARALNIIRSQFHQVEVEAGSYSQQFRAILALVEEGRQEEARKQVPVLREQMSRFSRAIRTLNDQLEWRVEAAVEQTRLRQERAGLMVVGLSAAAILFGLIMIGVTHIVLKPISRLIEGVKSIAGGDYQSRVAIEAEDEIGTLAREFNVMAGSLEEREASLRASRVDLERAYLDLKAAHQELRTLSLYNHSILHSIEVGLLVCDPAGVVTTMNPAAEHLWGLSAAEVVGQALSTQPALSAVADAPEEVLERLSLFRREGVELPVKDGSSRLLDCTFVPLLDEQASVLGVIVLSEDVTERTRTRQRLMQSERLALIGRMSAQVTHEIRNPLNALGLNTELLADELLGLDPARATDAWGLLASISREIDRLTEVTESYLRLARLPSPQLDRQGVGEIVQSLLAFLQEELASRGIRVDYQEGEGVPEALVDENQLRQALLNLFRNAREAMGEGGELRLRLERSRGGLELIIQDTGEGIDPQVLGRIFDPFYSTKSTGTGLGLPITWQIVEQHGGQLRCESLAGEGTTFRMWLPAAA